MIRDFWKVKKRRLKDEIDALKTRLDAKSWQAIDSVRTIGNIGAHMEKDINAIVDVEPREAALLLQLIETLIEQWYVERHERDQRMESVIAAAKAKAELKKPSAAAPPQNAAGALGATSDPAAPNPEPK